MPKNRDVRDLLRLYGVDDDDELAGRLFALATDGQSQGWWEDYKDLSQETGTEYVGRYLALEQEATSILGYEGDMIHGLLQTPEYADALLTALAPDVPAEQRERMVELRMKRQAILHERAQLPPLRLRVVLGEPAILRPVGSTKIMQRQLQAIRELVEKRSDNIDLRVMPLAAGPHAGLGSPFSSCTSTIRRTKTSCTWKARRAERTSSASRMSIDSRGCSSRCKGRPGRARSRSQRSTGRSH